VGFAVPQPAIRSRYRPPGAADGGEVVHGRPGRVHGRERAWTEKPGNIIPLFLLPPVPNLGEEPKKRVAEVCA